MEGFKACFRNLTWFHTRRDKSRRNWSPWHRWKTTTFLQQMRGMSTSVYLVLGWVLGCESRCWIREIIICVFCFDVLCRPPPALTNPVCHQGIVRRWTHALIQNPWCICGLDRKLWTECDDPISLRKAFTQLT